MAGTEPDPGHGSESDHDSDSGFDRLPEGVIILRDGSIRLANRRARAMLAGAGMSLEEPGWPVGHRLDEVATFIDEAGYRLRLPDGPPRVGDRYAERIVHLRNQGSDRALAIEGRWSGDELLVTMRSAARRIAAVRHQGDVVATVAHELRSPLTSVKGFTRTLLSRWDRFSDDEKRTMLATIEQDADRVTRLLTDLLEVSRIDARRVKLHRSVVALGELAEAVADKARMRGLRPDIEVRVAPDVPDISADRDKVEQILTNLVDNAVQHAPGTPVTISVEPVDAGVSVTVADLGPGIDPSVEPDLFRKFGRGRSAHRTGTGLGLFLTKGLVEAHGGSIRLDPSPAQGATFQVLLPRGIAPG